MKVLKEEGGKTFTTVFITSLDKLDLIGIMV